MILNIKYGSILSDQWPSIAMVNSVTRLTDGLVNYTPCLKHSILKVGIFKHQNGECTILEVTLSAAGHQLQQFCYQHSTYIKLH